MISFSKLKIVAIAGAIAMGASVWAFASSDKPITDIPPIVDTDGNIVLDGIASLERVILGDVEQTILVRAQNTDQPVLLFLHGGPGGVIIPWVDFFHTPLLEENFTIVHWDQRGAGSSYSSDLTVEDLSPEKFIADTLELTDILRKRFGQDKIFLAGQSWGSALGFMTIAEDSSPFHAFITISERVEWNRSMTMGFNWVVEQAQANGDAEILAQLKAIEPFDSFDEADLAVQRKALDFYRGGDYHTVGLWDKILKYTFDGESPYYTMEQVNKVIPAMELTQAAIESADILSTYNLFKLFPVSDIPVHFMTGTEDHNTPGELAFEYYEALEAPAKSFTWIDGAAHMIMMDQPEAWAKALIEIKDLTLKD